MKILSGHMPGREKIEQWYTVTKIRPNNP